MKEGKQRKIPMAKRLVALKDQIKEVMSQVEIYRDWFTEIKLFFDDSLIQSIDRSELEIILCSGTTRRVCHVRSKLPCSG